MSNTNIRLVSNAAQVRENHARYQKEMSSVLGATISSLIEVIPYIHSWIAIRDPSGKFSFAPSKYVGYRNMTAETYERHHQQMDGRHTEVAIRDWIRVMAEGDPGYDEARDELFDFCSRVGKKPNGRCRISVLLDVEHADESDSPGRLSELLVEVYKTLPVAEQRAVARRIAMR
jgi:hypothetical protein